MAVNFLQFLANLLIAGTILRLLEAYLNRSGHPLGAALAFSY